MVGMYDEDGDLIDEEILLWELTERKTTLSKLEAEEIEDKKRVFKSKSFKRIKKSMTEVLKEINKMDVNMRFNMLFTIVSGLYDRTELPHYCKKYVFNRADRIQDRMLELEEKEKKKYRKELKYVG